MDKMTFTSNQFTTDKSVRALIRTCQEKKPLVLLIDDRYRLFPYDLSTHVYVVLGYYTIVDFWGTSNVVAVCLCIHVDLAEREPTNNALGFCVKFKFAFQWCEAQGHPWWISTSGAWC